MKNRKSILTTLLIAILLGGFLRFYNITINPPSLNIDEVAYGYSAYSILKTGKDEFGEFMPITFKSIGDYKNPVLIYSLVPSIAIFGLNEFGVRFTTALAGTLSITVFFLLLETLLKNTRIALIGSILLSISPWHIYYSRYASDHLMGVFILMIGMLFFQKMIEKGRIWVFPSAFTLVLSMYTYHSQRFFVPLFIASLLILNLKKIIRDKLNILLFLLVSLLLLLPIIYLSLFGSANKRAGMIFLSLDIDYTRYVTLDHLHKQGENFLLLFFWIKKYLNYFQPGFLFFTGLNMTLPGTIGLGVLYLFELPWLVLGIIRLIKDKIPNKRIIIFWILLGILPASLTNNEQSTGRSLLVIPALLTIVAIGTDYFIRLIHPIKKIYIKFGIILTYLLFVIILLTHGFLVFTLHFPIQRSEDFMAGTKDAIEYVLLHKEQYKEFVFDPYRGIEANYIVSVPHLYYLFYSQYDPAIYQTEKKRQGEELFGFDKFTIRRIDWRSDQLKKGTLFIGSPWSLPLNDIKDGELLKKVYMTNGYPAYYIVSPK